MFIGHTRYSLFVPNSTAWRASNGSRFKTVEDYKQYLYSEDRMSKRDEIFLNVSLPALQIALEGFDCAHVVSFSESLPEKYKNNLRKAAAKFSFLVLDEQPEGGLGVNVNELARGKVGSRGTFGRYRLDDDDVLSTRYFSLMAEYLRPEFAGMVVSLPRGVVAIRDSGRVFNLKEAYYPMHSMGLMSICQFKETGELVSPVSSAHNLADRHNPVIIDSRELGYFRFNHTGQDNAMGSSENVSLAKIAKQMERYPSLPLRDELKGLFPTVVPDVTDGGKKTLVGEDVQATDSFQCQLDPESSCFEISYEATFRADVDSKDFLLSFDVVDAQGERVHTDRQIPGLTLSSNDSYGYYRYLPAEPGRVSSKESVMMPEDLWVRSVTFVDRRKSLDPFILHSVKFESILA